MNVSRWTRRSRRRITVMASCQYVSRNSHQQNSPCCQPFTSAMLKMISRDYSNPLSNLQRYTSLSLTHSHYFHPGIPSVQNPQILQPTPTKLTYSTSHDESY